MITSQPEESRYNRVVVVAASDFAEDRSGERYNLGELGRREELLSEGHHK
jgi:hypothetical protein